MKALKLMAGGAALLAAASVAHAGTTFDAVQKRGFVQCGVSTGVAGFSIADSKGKWTGLDVDFCPAVAATMFGDAGKVKFTDPVPGTLWGGGAGGGTSAFFAQPAYQQGVVPDSLADSVDGTPARVSPDVAALADPYTGFQIALRPIDDSTCTPSGDCQVGDLEYETYGGTSLASPITAAEHSVPSFAASC